MNFNLIKSIGQGGSPLTLIVALTTVLRTHVLHCDDIQI